MDRARGKVAVVTGAASNPGLGRAIALTLAREGARVVVTDIDERGLAECAEVIQKGGGEALAVRHDVTREADWEAVLARTLDAFGRLDVLVNNAGIAVLKTLDDMTLADWNRQIEVNLTSVFLGCKHAVPAMRRSGGGSIVNISSVAGIGQSLHQEPAYAASKGAIRIFTKVTASQHAQDRIRCNSVHPGPIDTEMLHAAMPDPAVLKRRLERVPLGRMGTVDEVVRLVLYLASDESAYMTGSELVIDGGALAQ